jgi:flagellar biosynthesis/type III secretory pathway ATPase
MATSPFTKSQPHRQVQNTIIIVQRQDNSSIVQRQIRYLNKALRCRCSSFGVGEGQRLGVASSSGCGTGSCRKNLFFLFLFSFADIVVTKFFN